MITVDIYLINILEELFDIELKILIDYKNNQNHFSLRFMKYLSDLRERIFNDLGGKPD